MLPRPEDGGKECFIVQAVSGIRHSYRDGELTRTLSDRHLVCGLLSNRKGALASSVSSAAGGGSAVC